MGNNNGAFHYQNAHSNFTVRWPIKTEHSAFKAVVTRVTLPSFRDSRYIVTRVTMFKTLWFGVKRPNMCDIVTILSSTVFDLISGLSAYVTLGPKNRPN